MRRSKKIKAEVSPLRGLGARECISGLPVTGSLEYSSRGRAYLRPDAARAGDDAPTEYVSTSAAGGADGVSTGRRDRSHPSTWKQARTKVCLLYTSDAADE